MEGVVDERLRCRLALVVAHDLRERQATVLGGEGNDGGGPAAGGRHAARVEVIGGDEAGARHLVDVAVRIDATGKDETV